MASTKADKVARQTKRAHKALRTQTNNVRQKRKLPHSKRAKELVEEFGLCPISLMPMRRPVLPSSGQAYDEINIVRFCSSGKRKCPVSGAALKFTKGKVARVPDYALRSMIRHQALRAKVYIPPVDKDALLRELEGGPPEALRDACKAVVDDTYLGYLAPHDLRGLLNGCVADAKLPGPKAERAAGILRQLVAECLACRAPELVALGVAVLGAQEGVWSCPRVLQEALSAGENPDCRGNVLKVIKDVAAARGFAAVQLGALLEFETESVPVQQCQVQVADLVLRHLAADPPKPPQAGLGALGNLALHVRMELAGVCEHLARSFSFSGGWGLALRALQRAAAPLDARNLERLFHPHNRLALSVLARADAELLQWHLRGQPRAVELLISVAAACRGCGADEASMWQGDSEDFTSDEDDLYEEEDELYTRGVLVRTPAAA